VEHDTVAEQLHRAAAVLLGEVVDDPGEAARQLGRGPLQAGHHRGGDLVEVVGPGLVRVALGAEAVVDVVVEQAHLRLGQAPQAVAELPGRAQQGRRVVAEALQGRDGQAQQLVLVGPEGLAGLGPGSSQASNRRPASCSGAIPASASASITRMRWMSEPR
jgi:hypothetical protein